MTLNERKLLNAAIELAEVIYLRHNLSVREARLCAAVNLVLEDEKEELDETTE